MIDPTELQTIVAAINTLGAEAKSAFIWWVVQQGVFGFFNFLGWIAFLGTVIYLVKWLVNKFDDRGRI